MKTIEERVKILAEAFGDDIAEILRKIGNLNLLTTTNKTNIVDAINEAKSTIPDNNNTKNNSYFPNGW